MKNKTQNRARRIARRIRECIADIKSQNNLCVEIENDEQASQEDRNRRIKRIRDRLSPLTIQLRALEERAVQLPEPVKIRFVAPEPTRFVSHSWCLVMEPHPHNQWRRISRRQCKAVRAFFAVASAL